jgi:hypothetical protein
MALSALLFLLVVSPPIVALCESDALASVPDSILKELSALSATSEQQESRHDCHLAYSKLYGDDTLSVGIFLGVMDTQRGTSLDGAAKNFLIGFLARECRPNYFACGFTRESVEPTVLRKATTDSQNILISIHDSSVSDRFETSTQELLTEQQNKSKQTTDLFLLSIERDDVVFYVGHSRYGTGPGFSWIRPFSSQWLSTFVHSPVLSDIVRTLDQDATPPKVFGVFGCNSERYYARDLHTAAPNMGLIVSNGITTHISNLAEALNAVNSILGNLCYSDSANSRVKLDPSSAYKLYGIFESNTFPQFRKRTSLSSVTVFILLLPLFILFGAKPFSIGPFVSYETRKWLKDIVALFAFLVIILAVAKLLSAVHDSLGDQSLPLFLFLIGTLLLIWFSYQQRLSFRNVADTVKSYSVPVLFAAAVYFGMGFLPAPGTHQFFVSVTQSIKFVVICLCLLPFVVFSTGILKYPLYGPIKLNSATRVLLFVAIAEIFCIGISYSVAYLSFWLALYRIEIFLLLLAIQCVSLLLYLLSSSVSSSILFQTLTLGVIFAEDIHGLFV